MTMICFNPCKNDACLSYVCTLACVDCTDVIMGDIPKGATVSAVITEQLQLGTVCPLSWGPAYCDFVQVINRLGELG